MGIFPPSRLGKLIERNFSFIVLQLVSFHFIIFLFFAFVLGRPQLSSNTTVVIELVDRAMPIFTHRLYRSRISESAPVGSAVLTVKAISNMGSRIGYIIASGDPEKHFRIDFDSGISDLDF